MNDSPIFFHTSRAACRKKNFFGGCWKSTSPKKGGVSTKPHLIASHCSCAETTQRLTYNLIRLERSLRLRQEEVVNWMSRQHQHGSEVGCRCTRSKWVVS